MKLFIDAGAHEGESLKKFLKSDLYDGEFLIYAFEPSLDCYKKLNEKYGKYNPDDPTQFIFVYNQAIWIYLGEIDLYIDKQDKKVIDKYGQGQGSSLFKSKLSGKLDKKNPQIVQCIDFSDWILTMNLEGVKQVILKMDIEGAEYKVLDQMIETGAINHIDILFIEWHWEVIGMKKEDHEKLLRKLKAVKTLDIREEYSKV